MPGLTSCGAGPTLFGLAKDTDLVSLLPRHSCWPARRRGDGRRSPHGCCSPHGPLLYAPAMTTRCTPATVANIKNLASRGWHFAVRRSGAGGGPTPAWPDERTRLHPAAARDAGPQARSRKARPDTAGPREHIDPMRVIPTVGRRMDYALAEPRRAAPSAARPPDPHCTSMGPAAWDRGVQRAVRRSQEGGRPHHGGGPARTSLAATAAVSALAPTARSPSSGCRPRISSARSNGRQDA